MTKDVEPISFGPISNQYLSHGVVLSLARPLMNDRRSITG
jgi:hypothetical protein